MASVAHPPLDVHEFDALMAAGGWRTPLERLAGEVVGIPPIGGRQSAVTLNLSYAIQRWQERTGDRGLLLADVPLSLGEDRPVPDLSWWTEARRPEIPEGSIATVPDIVVEVLSPRTRENDLGVKRDIYEHARVAEYWRVDPTDQVILVGHRAAGRLVDLAPLVGEDVLTSPLLEGFGVAAGALFSP